MRHKLPEIRLDGALWLVLPLLLLTVPLNWLLAAFTAAVIHELGHAATIQLTGGRILALRIGLTGAEINTSFDSVGQEVLCTSAGPAASLLLLLMGGRFPRLSLCGGLQAAFNLLPIYPMDGGRLLRCTACAVFGQARGEKICRHIAAVVCVLLAALCVWTGRTMGLLIPVALAVPVWKKYLANRACSGYNRTGLCHAVHSRSFLKRYGYDRYKTANPAHGTKARPLHRRRVG